MDDMSLCISYSLYYLPFQLKKNLKKKASYFNFILLPLKYLEGAWFWQWGCNENETVLSLWPLAACADTVHFKWSSCWETAGPVLAWPSCVLWGLSHMIDVATLSAVSHSSKERGGAQSHCLVPPAPCFWIPTWLSRYCWDNPWYCYLLLMVIA